MTEIEQFMLAVFEIMAIAIAIVLVLASYATRPIDDYEPTEDVLRMGNMKTFWIFGFEPWGRMKPAQMTTKEGVVYKPLFWGLWIKQ